MDVIGRLFTLFNGIQVGSDNAGNRYFIERRARADGAPPRRWVIHPRAATASSVPPGWHAWLQFTGQAAAGGRKP
jgi:NADH:ubiquinone oxidoreductase subunit